jgi:hypothetical protein
MASEGDRQLKMDILVFLDLPPLLLLMMTIVALTL